MTGSAHGIILRRRLLTETSLVVHWLTPELGRLATVAKGARRPKSPFLGKLDLFYEADFSFSRSRRSDLHVLREVTLRETHRRLREDVVALQRAAYACAFIEQATETETPLPAVFGLLEQFLAMASQGKAAVPMVFAFELKLLQELGLAPDLAGTALTPGTKKIATRLAQDDFSRNESLRLTAAQTDELRQFLHGFLIFHLGKLPRGRAAALADQF